VGWVVFSFVVKPWGIGGDNVEGAVWKRGRFGLNFLGLLHFFEALVNAPDFLGAVHVIEKGAVFLGFVLRRLNDIFPMENAENFKGEAQKWI